MVWRTNNSKIQFIHVIVYVFFWLVFRSIRAAHDMINEIIQPVLVVQMSNSNSSHEITRGRLWTTCCHRLNFMTKYKQMVPRYHIHFTIYGNYLRMSMQWNIVVSCYPETETHWVIHLFYEFYLFDYLPDNKIV